MFVGPSEAEFIMLMRQILYTKIPLYYRYSYKQTSNELEHSFLASFQLQSTASKESFHTYC